MYLAALKLGRILFSMGLASFWLELSVLLFSIGAGVLLVIELRKHRPSHTASTGTSMAQTPTPFLRTKAGRISKGASLVLIGAIVGWSARTLQQFSHTYVLSDVRVLKRNSANYYLMQTDHHVDFTFRLCPDSVADLVEGSTLQVLVYEDRGTCNSISEKKLGFIVKRDPITGWPAKTQGD